MRSRCDIAGDIAAPYASNSMGSVVGPLIPSIGFQGAGPVRAGWASAGS